MFGSNNLFFLLSMLATIIHIHASQKYKEGVCSDVLVDVCNIGCADFTINDVTSSSLCQVACNANAEYKSWTFDKAYQTCNLIACDLSIWTQNCDKIGAPADVDLNQCLAENSGCSSFKHGGCQLDESYKIKEVYLNLEDCRYFCSVDPQCAYFISTFQICDIYSKKPFSDDDCKRTSGSTEPDIEQCTAVGQYLIAGSHKDASTEVVELVKTSSPPSFGQLPGSNYDSAVGGMLGTAPLICGGGGGNSNCIIFQNSQWMNLPYSMNDARYDAAGVQINSTTFWILGGLNREQGINYLRSTEFIIQDQTKAVPGPDLPGVSFGQNGMCAVMLSEKEIFVIGGTQDAKRVSIFDPQNGFTLSSGTSLPSPGRYYHSCSKMRDGDRNVIVVAGGQYGDPLDSVLIYDPNQPKYQEWISGPTLPFPVLRSAMAESPDGKGVLLFGGEGEIQDRILELRAGANSWNILNITLEKPRSSHVVIPLQ